MQGRKRHRRREAQEKIVWEERKGKDSMETHDLFENLKK